MIVHQISVGPMQNFCYIVEDESTHEAIIIDPSWDLEKITDIINEQNLNPKYIVNTHWHDDHTRGNEELAKILSIKIVQHEESTLQNDMTVKNGDLIKFGCSEFVVYYTPGHSKDGICLVGDGKIFQVILYLLEIVEELIFQVVVQVNFITVYLIYFIIWMIILYYTLVMIMVRLKHQPLVMKKLQTL